MILTVTRFACDFQALDCREVSSPCSVGKPTPCPGSIMSSSRSESQSSLLDYESESLPIDSSFRKCSPRLSSGWNTCNPNLKRRLKKLFPIRNWGPWVNTFNKIIVIITLNWSDWRRRTWNHNQFPAYALKFCMNLVSRGNPCVWVKTASVITTVTGGHTDTKKGGASCDSDFKKNEKKNYSVFTPNFLWRFRTFQEKVS